MAESVSDFDDPFHWTTHQPNPPQIVTKEERQGERDTQAGGQMIAACGGPTFLCESAAGWGFGLYPSVALAVGNGEGPQGPRPGRDGYVLRLRLKRPRRIDHASSDDYCSQHSSSTPQAGHHVLSLAPPPPPTCKPPSPGHDALGHGGSNVDGGGGTHGAAHVPGGLQAAGNLAVSRLTSIPTGCSAQRTQHAKGSVQSCSQQRPDVLTMRVHPLCMWCVWGRQPSLPSN